MLQLAQEKIGHHFIEVVTDYEIDGMLQRCLETNMLQTGVVETSYPRRFLRVIATPLENEHSCLLLIQDLTELRRLETVRRDFISNISHELRTPVTSIKALA